MSMETRIKKLKENEEFQNLEINKLIERNKILKDMIDINSESIRRLNESLINILTRRCY